MKAAPILVVLALGAMLGWVAPDVVGSGDTASARGGDGLRPARAETCLDVVQRQQQQWYAGEVVLQRDPDGHFYADVTVHGSTRPMLVDTGASVMALTGEDASAMGVRWNQADIRPVARGASGAVYGVDVTLDTVQVGALKASAVEAVVVPHGLGVSLLGQSFLSTIDKVQIDQDRMVLGG